MEIPINAKYNASYTTSAEFQICFMKEIPLKGTTWQLQNNIVNSLPYLCIKLGVIILLSRILIFLFKPLRQPHFVAEVTAAIIIGPTLYGNTDSALEIFPFETTMLLESFANLGLTYYMFLVGLEIDLSIVKHIEKKSWSIAVAGTLIPFFTGAGLYFLPLHANNTKQHVVLKPDSKGAAFWAIALTITSFPDLARILSDAKLLHTDLGRIALNTALISDISAWVLLVATIACFDNHKLFITAVPTIVYLVICFFLLRPGIAWMIKQTKKNGGRVGDKHIYPILVGVAVSGLFTDGCGVHSILGGFIFGLMIPNGELAIMIMEKTQEFVTGMMLPAFIFLTGLRINLMDLRNTDWKFSLLVIFLCTSAKIVSTIVVSLFFGMSTRDGFALGSLMNTKGIFALIVLNEGRSLKNLDEVTMALMSLTILFMTSLVGPICFFVNKTAKLSRHYKQRTIQRSNPQTELRILTCIHSAGHLSGIIKLLEITNATRKSPIHVFAVHLAELTGRASAMLLVHDKLKTRSGSSTDQEMLEPDQIITAFENYERGNDAVSVHQLTVVSPYATMHKDISNLAEDKRAAMILIPFIRKPSADGGLQIENHSRREVNQNLLAKTPCSVGILIDRGLGSSICSETPSDGKPGLRLAVLFIGGPDDREAVSYAWRMVRTPGVTLTVVRYLPGKDGEQNMFHEDENNDDDFLETIMERESQKALDDDFINDFSFRSMCEPSITYCEKQVNGCDELLESLKTKYNGFDLYIVGRGVGMKSPLTTGLEEWSENPELGPIGDTLMSSDFMEHSSVLVVQQCPSVGSQHRKETLGKQKWASPILDPDFSNTLNIRKKP